MHRYFKSLPRVGVPINGLVERLPLDVLLLILRLLNFRDAFALFLTCKDFFAVSQVRPFWVYANLDADSFWRLPKFCRINYVNLSVAALQARISRSRRVFDSWSSDGLKPATVLSMPLDGKTRQLLAVPWTSIVVTVEDAAVRIINWQSKALYVIPLSLANNMQVVCANVYWVHALGGYILVISLSNSGRSLDLRTELRLFSVDLIGPSVAHLVTMQFSHWIPTFSLADTHLAVVGYRISYDTPVNAETLAFTCIGRWWPVASSSFAILNDNHFLLANVTGLAVYSCSRCTSRCRFADHDEIRPCWSHRYAVFDLVVRPPLSTVLVDASNGELTISICGGNFLRRLVMTEGTRPAFRLAQKDLMKRVPRDWAVVGGLRFGAYHVRPGSSFLSIFRVLDGGDRVGDLHPFSIKLDSKAAYSIAYSVEGAIEPGTFNIDEGEGRLVFMCIPLDVLFLILRLVPLGDAFAIFMTCKHFLAVAKYRPFWVYVNIDLDFLQRRPGYGQIDYSTMEIYHLQKRILRAREVFDAWRMDCVRPKHVYEAPVDVGVRQVFAIPWTQILVTLIGEAIRLDDWGSHTSYDVSMDRGDMLVISFQLFWVDCIGRNVLVVVLSNRTLHMTAVEFPHPIWGISLVNGHLAVVGHTAPRSYFIQSLDVTYDCRATSGPLAMSKAFVVLGAQGTLSASSFAILDDTHFLLANPAGIAVYRLSKRILTHHGLTPRRIRPCWQHPYKFYEIVARPPLGPVLEDRATGSKTISICSGSYLRRLSMTGTDRPQFEVSRRTLIERTPAFLGLTAGSRIGVYHRPYCTPAFITFPVMGTDAESAFTT
ncbi:hypothetical protein B0H16DRAFT_1465186 [Mycena metata]|uniref:F-box domain-containing protein n=1 Tax=Mycena metata TaxID=1033252 RepID=A0AAD7MZQ2_9AGAR|nr:hypothetical protein B0H16DRAFT_1465186 [Mycena metata]